MNTFHKNISVKWHQYNLFEQMANIGADVGRAINWKRKNDLAMSTDAFYRALELIDFSINDPKNNKRLSEILRLREMLVDFFEGKNIYHSTDRQWEKYFYHFNLAARRKM